VSRFAYPSLRYLKGDEARRRDAAVSALVEWERGILFKFYSEILVKSQCIKVVAIIILSV